MCDLASAAHTINSALFYWLDVSHQVLPTLHTGLPIPGGEAIGGQLGERSRAGHRESLQKVGQLFEQRSEVRVVAMTL